MTDIRGDLDRRAVDLFRTVPLGMSRFQVTDLVVKKDGAGRTYRQAVLELHKRYGALKKAEFRRKRLAAQEALLRDRIGRERNPHKQRLLEVDLEEKLHDASMEDVLIEDCLTEVSTLLDAVGGIPEYTRERFEAEEPGYWRKHLLLQARREVLAGGRVSAGTLEALERVGLPPEQVALEVQASVKANLEALTAGTPPAAELPPNA